MEDIQLTPEGEKARIRLNFAMVLIDSIHSMMIDVEWQMRKEGQTLKQDHRRRWNMMLNNLSNLRKSMHQVALPVYNFSETESALKDADDYYELLDLICDRIGSDWNAFKCIKHMIHECPSQLGFYDTKKR